MPTFFQKNKLQKGMFFEGVGPCLGGLMYIYREDFDAVNGYNEYIQTYGYDDIDLYDRLQAMGLKKIGTEEGTAIHLPHRRIGNRKSRRRMHNHNKMIAEQTKWDKNHSQTVFEKKHIDGVLICEEKVGPHFLGK
jgi:GT2 family glycosyltransferase